MPKDEPSGGDFADRPLPQPGVDVTAGPPWWLTRPDEILRFLESLAGVEVEEIGRTAGGRAIVAASYGPREDLPGRTCRSLASAMSGHDTSSFYGRGMRERQSVLFVGAAHGTELEGTVAALNYLNVLVTGRDLLGREQAGLAEAGRKHRFCIVPILNVDGRRRYADHVHWIGCDADYQSMVTMGRLRSGEILRWPDAKVNWPVPVERMSHLGSYYNDAGYNLVYDGPHAGDCQPETTALIRLCRREMPDVVVLSHSNHGSLVDAPASYIPASFKQKTDQLGAAVGMRCLRAGLAKSGIAQRSTSYAGDIFYQGDAVYHACGALPVLIEFPCGWENVPDNHRSILDIGLAVLEEVAVFGAHYRFRPRDSCAGAHHARKSLAAPSAS